MSTFALKIVAMLCMLTDHIGEFIPNSPIWFRYIGRLAAPIFFFCSAWGLYYTHNRKKYLMRLYAMNVVMAVGNLCILLGISSKVYVSSNIFTTIFLGCVIVSLWEQAKSCRQKCCFLILLMIQQAIAFILCVLIGGEWGIPDALNMGQRYSFYGSLFCSCIFTEGGILFVFFFIMLYVLKKNKGHVALFIGFFSFFLAVLSKASRYLMDVYEIGGILIDKLIPFMSFQWLMLLSIPFIWSFSGEKGRNIKYFFYIFYPVHIWILCIWGYLMK